MNTVKLVGYVVLGTLVAALLGACGNQPTPESGTQTTPQIIVVTATATAVAEVTAILPTATTTPMPTDSPTLPTATTTPMPTDSPTLPTATTTVIPTEIAVNYKAGALLKGSGEGVFYLMADGSRQHIYDWLTFFQLGFKETAIVIVSDEVLARYPLNGELSRLLMDKSDGLYWVSQGQRWLAMDVQPIIYAKDYQGPPPTLADDALLAKLPLQQTARPGPFLRQGDTVYYFYRDTLVPVTADMVDENEILDVPASALANLTLQPESVATITPIVTIELQPQYCDVVPMRGFGKVWGEHAEVQTRLGCAYSWQGGEKGVKAAIQPFEHGLMLWFEAESDYNKDPIYVLFADGSYQRFSEVGAADPAKVETVPSGFMAVGDKFSKVYWEGTGARVKERLGWPTGEAADSDGAYQQFDNGRMFWAGKIDTIFVIYDYYQYDANNNSTRILEWTQFEDTF